MDYITQLKPNEIFVFGSNLSGIHGAGAARLASKQFGAEFGVGEGLTGQCYAIPTKDNELRTRPLNEIYYSVMKFIDTAKRRKDLTFLVTPIGCGLAGYNEHQIAPLFSPAIHVDNIVLPKEFLDHIKR